MKNIVGYSLGLLLVMTGCASTDPALRGTPYGLTVVTFDESYDITGSTGRELRQGIRQKGPKIGGKSYAGEMYWRIRWRYRSAPSGGECRMEQVEAEIEATIILPRWTPPDEVSEDLLQQWKGYLEALSLHEEGHRKIAVEAGSEIIRTLKAMHAPTCNYMDSDANKRARDILEKHRARNRQYDIDTSHGATQGARWS